MDEMVCAGPAWWLWWLCSGDKPCLCVVVHDVLFPTDKAFRCGPGHGWTAELKSTVAGGRVGSYSPNLSRSVGCVFSMSGPAGTIFPHVFSCLGNFVLIAFIT